MTYILLPCQCRKSFWSVRILWEGSIQGYIYILNRNSHNIGYYVCEIRGICSGKELFEGVQGGIEICSASTISPLVDSDMSIVEEMKPHRKRKFFDERSNLTDTT